MKLKLGETARVFATVTVHASSMVYSSSHSLFFLFIHKRGSREHISREGGVHLRKVDGRRGQNVERYGNMYETSRDTV